MNIVIACGGTGGHLFPGMAVAEEMTRRGHAVCVLISEKQIDQIAASEHQDRFVFHRLPTVGLSLKSPVALLRFLYKFAVSVARCRTIFRNFRPDAVLGMGGFTSSAPLLAGWLSGLPVALHESNAIPGKTNRLNAKLCRRILLGFAECAAFFPGKRCEVTGTPLRENLLRPVNREEALAELGLSPTLKTLLVMGGSQGASGLNRLVVAAAPQWQGSLQIIHLTGQDDESSVKEQYRSLGVPGYVAAFYHKMQKAYAVADLVIARSGAASLSEIAHFGLASLLVPYPHAAEDHQTANAKIMVDRGAALMLPEGSTTAAQLAASVRDLLADPARLEAMAAKAKGPGSAGAAAQIADKLESIRQGA